VNVEAVQTQTRLATAVQNRVPTWVMPAVTVSVVLIDAALAVLCFVLAFKMRDGNAVLSSTAWAWSKSFVPYSGVLFLAAPIRIVMLWYQRVYRFYGAFSFMQEAIKIFKAVLVGSLLIVAWAFLFRGGYSFRERDINLAPTIVVGTNEVAERTIVELGRRKYLGYRLIGIVTANGSRSAEHSFSDDAKAVPILGSIDDLADIVKRYRIQEVIITDDTIESSRLFESMMAIGRSQRVEFRTAPSLFNLLPQKTSVEQIGVLPMVRLFTEPLTDAQRFLKRASDIVISAFGIAVTSPLWLLFAVLIKRDSRGPVFFRQERVGMDGRIFLCLKFRTMHADADEGIHRETYRKNIAGRTDANAGDDTKPVFGKVPNDGRITRVGRWLRRSSLDELPQLINVLRGEMSVVGPRPPIPYEVREYDIWQRRRLDMKPGITGLWQVSGRNRLTFDEMVRIDLYYIENWSLWLDLKVILLTLPAVWRDDGGL